MRRSPSRETQAYQSVAQIFFLLTKITPLIVRYLRQADAAGYDMIDICLEYHEGVVPGLQACKFGCIVHVPRHVAKMTWASQHGE